jgi:hypothetical protein
MANIPIYIPTYINSPDYTPARVQPRLLFYNGMLDCESYYIESSSAVGATSKEQTAFPYFDNYNVVTGSFPTVNSNSLLFYNEEAVYGQVPTETLYSTYWEKYVELLYNPRTKLLNASAIIPLADYFKMSQNDIVEFRGNYYHLRAINDYSLKNGECGIQLLGPILSDSLNLPNNVLYPKCLGYDPTDCGIACYSICECNPPCPTFQFTSTTVSDLVFTIKAEGPFVPNAPTYTFKLPVTNNGYYSCSVDWGDGTTSIISGSNSPNIYHTYATGSYTASISGLYQSFDVRGTSNVEARTVINGVQQWGNTGATKVNFGQTRNRINMDMVYPQPGQFTWTDANNLFFAQPVSGFPLVEGGIAKGNTIKEDLFYYCTNVRLFQSIFSSNAFLTNIPENLFNRCYTGVQFGSSFFNANREGFISGSFCTLPSGSGFFSSGSYDGFKNMGNMFFNFYNLDTLYSASFDNTITAGSSMNATQLFAYSDARGTNPIQGQAPAIWTLLPNITGTDAFNNCTNLSNYDDIPAGFK